MNIDMALEDLRKLVIFRYGGFEFKAVGNKWLHEMDEEEEECSKPRKQIQPDNNRSRKDVSASAKAARTVHCFWRKCSVVVDRERLSHQV